MISVLAAAAAQAGSVVHAVQLDVGQHSVAMPFDHLGRVRPFDPAVSLAAEHTWVRAGGFRLAQQARVAFLSHTFVGHTAQIGTDVIARGALPAGPLAEVGLGIAATDTWRSRGVLERDGETYAPATDPGTLGVALGAQLALGYDLPRSPITPLIQYRWMAQTPFYPALPVGPHSTLSLGIRWALGGA